MNNLKDSNIAKSKDIVLAEGMRLWANQKAYSSSLQPLHEQPQIEEEDDDDDKDEP